MRPVIGLSNLHGSLLTLQVLKKMQAKYPQAPIVFGGDYQDSFHHHTGVRVAQRIQAMQLWSSL